MITYIQKDCIEYVELESELDPECYLIGISQEDYEAGKWVALSEEQLRFKEEHPDASKEEVINMEIAQAPEPTPEQLLREAQREKEQEAFASVEDRYHYYLDDADIYTGNRLSVKDKCGRTDSMTINGKAVRSDLLCVALDEMSDYEEKVSDTLNATVTAIREAPDMETLQGIDIDADYPEVIRTTTAELQAKIEERNRQSEQTQAVAFARAMINTVQLSAAQALQMQILFPVWGEEGAEYGKEVGKGFRLQAEGKLYEVIQKHKLQAEWKPAENLALYKVVTVEHAGTLEDPIPYEQGMSFEKGKYYEQYGVVYRCILTTVTGYPNDLKDLPTIVTEVE